MRTASLAPTCSSRARSQVKLMLGGRLRRQIEGKMKIFILCMLLSVFTMVLSSQPLPGTSLEILLENYRYKQLSNLYMNDDSGLVVIPAYYRENIKSVLSRLLDFNNKEHFSINEDKVSTDKVVITIKWKDFNGGTKYYLVDGNEVHTNLLSFYYYSNLTTEKQLNDLLNRFYNSKIVDITPSNEILFEYNIKIPEKYKVLSIDGLTYRFDTIEKQGIPVLSIQYNPLVNVKISLKDIANVDGLDDINIKEIMYNGLDSEFQYWQGIFIYEDKVINKVAIKTDKTKYIIISRQMFDEDLDIVKNELHGIVDSIMKKQ
jgi:hypothetical protein